MTEDRPYDEFQLVAYREDDRARWDEFAKTYGTLFHCIAWKNVLESSFGYQAPYQMLLDKQGNIAALFPLCVGRNLKGQKVGVSLPFVGYVDLCARDETARSAIVSQMPDLRQRYRLNYLECRLLSRLPEKTAASLNEENVSFLLSLEGGESAVLAKASRDNRRRTRLVYQGDWFEVSRDAKHLAKFYQVFRRRQKQLGSPAPSVRFFENIRDKLLDQFTLLTAHDKREKRLVGGMILLADGDTLHYPWGATLVEYNTRHLNHFLYREAIKFAIGQGFSLFDMGRSPQNMHGGTYHFKEQFGAQVAPLYYYRFSDDVTANTYWSNAVGNLRPAIELWKKLPEPLTNAAGHFLITHAMP